jgi:glycosyltransferase involved in cell wall biosynthesis
VPNPLKISVITVCLNSEKSIERTIRSVISQHYSDIEYLIIDGGSTDGTLPIIEKYRNQIDFVLSEPDAGVYDAINKGIKASTGEVVGVLNADDVYASNEVVTEIVDMFKNNDPDLLYGNLTYVKPNGTILRKWVSKTYQQGLFNWGWMPPHPTFYCKKQLFDQLGYYDINFGTAGDYELMVRFMHSNIVKSYYLNKIIVEMSVGGISNASFLSRMKAWKNDHKAMGKNGVKFPLVALLIKPLRKLGQFF